MTIVLRLQGLDVKAGAEDIRRFFDCLFIPDGGVFIIGGNLREAFIAFTTEKDGQLAMRYTGSFLKGSKVTLHISSMEELEQKLTSKLKKNKPSAPQLPVKTPQPPSAADPSPSNAPSPDPETALLLAGLVTVLQGFQSYQQTAQQPTEFSQADGTTVVADEFRPPEEALKSRPGYVRLFGLPASVTKEEICHFFKGLLVQEAIVNVKLGLSRGCLVKFADYQDGCDALRFNNQLLGSFCVEVRGASEKMWTSAVQECESCNDLTMADVPVPTETQNEHKTRPFCDPMKPNQGPLEATGLHKRKATFTVPTKRHPKDHLLLKPQKKPRSDCTSTTGLSPTNEYNVMVSNLPKNITKTEIKELFGCPTIPHNKVIHLLDEEGNRTETAFVIFDQAEDYGYAMNLTGCHVGSDAIEVSSITRERMKAMIASAYARRVQQCLNSRTNAMKKPKRKRPSMNLNLPGQTCLYIRNMPADVQKTEVKDFFCKYKVREDNISLLHDNDGNGIGEAVVRFKSHKLAALAQRLHGQVYLGANVLLTCISVKQMKRILRGTF
uniref:RNA binding motif protein 12Ba n=1 Tax=Centroberyx gerrardi TaxID=166262 RepID=UPI003AB01D32